MATLIQQPTWIQTLISNEKWLSTCVNISHQLSLNTAEQMIRHSLIEQFTRSQKGPPRRKQEGSLVRSSYSSDELVMKLFRRFRVVAIGFG